MNSETHEIISRVNLAKTDSGEADKLISDYMPFIKAETAKFLNRSPDKSDDELSIAMFAFYEAIRNYSKLRGSFLKFAAMHIKNRLIDNYRREKRNSGNVSLYTSDDEKTELIDSISDTRDDYGEIEAREATKQEIAELSVQMADFGVSFTDIADNSPKQQRTLEICGRAVRYARNNPTILEDFLRTKRVPIAALAEGTGAERKTLERHRKYLVAMLLICTNGYEIMRGHIMQVLKGGENN
ncbi:MAG: RNA polymerase subunit sigma [Ruminococcus sp.]|nr:RNA polymerase subunit sigma [Ruminococcus sp.]